MEGKIESVALQNTTPYRPVPSHFTPLSVDVLIFERVERDTSQWRTVPAYNTAHPNTAKWPNHFFVYAEPDDAPGWERWWYVADPLTQHLYNFEVANTLQNQWPQLTQTYLIERALYTGPGHTSGIVAPPALGKVWTRMGDGESRIGVEKLDSRFVVLRINYEDISDPILRQRIDKGSGQKVTVEIRKVPASTAAEQVNAQGYIVEVEPINLDWALSTKDKVSAMTGAGVRNFQMHRPYPWPPVLLGFATNTNVEGGQGYDYVMKTWDDECLIDVQEYWNETRPALSAPSTLGKTSIRWNGAHLNINIEPCLHPQINITETGSGASPSVRFRIYPATLYTDWPVSITVYPSVRPFPGGGYAIIKWVIYSPKGIVG